MALLLFAAAAPDAEAQRGAPPFTSPEVGADRSVTLRLYAPNAKGVVASGELDGKPHPLTRAENGVWSVRVGPLVPDIYTYDIISAMMAGDGKGGLSPVTKDIVEDVLPMIERDFKVSKRPDDRAIAGLSMGGGHSINIAFTRPEMFRYVALMSPAASARVSTIYAARLKNSAALNKQFKLFWLGVGKDDTLTGPGDRAFAEAIDKAGMSFVFKETEGRHEWTVWRQYLNEVAPLLFK